MAVEKVYLTKEQFIQRIKDVYAKTGSKLQFYWTKRQTVDAIIWDINHNMITEPYFLSKEEYDTLINSLPDYGHIELRFVADQINKEVHNGILCKVERTWKDRGAGIVWENIIVYNDGQEYQLLSPSEIDTFDHGSVEDQVNLIMSLINKLNDKKTGGN